VLLLALACEETLAGVNAAAARSVHLSGDAPTTSLVSTTAEAGGDLPGEIIGLIAVAVCAVLLIGGKWAYKKWMTPQKTTAIDGKLIPAAKSKSGVPNCHQLTNKNYMEIPACELPMQKYTAPLLATCEEALDEHRLDFTVLTEADFSSREEATFVYAPRQMWLTGPGGMEARCGTRSIVEVGYVRHYYALTAKVIHGEGRNCKVDMTFSRRSEKVIGMSKHYTQCSASDGSSRFECFPAFGDAIESEAERTRKCPQYDSKVWGRSTQGTGRSYFIKCCKGKQTPSADPNDKANWIKYTPS